MIILPVSSRPNHYGTCKEPDPPSGPSPSRAVLNMGPRESATEGIFNRFPERGSFRAVQVRALLSPVFGPGGTPTLLQSTSSPALITFPPIPRHSRNPGYQKTGRLFAAQLTALHHSSVLLLEPLVQALRALEVLVDAAHDALLFTVDQGLGGEIVDAVVETALDHLGVHLEIED